MKDSSLKRMIRSATCFSKMATMISGSSLLLLGACEKPSSQALASPPPAEQNRSGQLTSGLQFKQRQIEFLNRIRDADPQKQVIDRAMIEIQSTDIGRVIASLPGTVHGVEITDTSTLCDFYGHSNYHCRSLFLAEYLYEGCTTWRFKNSALGAFLRSRKFGCKNAQFCAKPCE